ncbi:unnamed protein product [Eruca vesicaria subsp. sativa]|uniref:Uncharacterized protein n=1 Tax=Eruca vesicaria subsp. sativa TaxID=29727 RepID=A0ABC8KH77_ERUVS|nr:unnamed protein product [Eruca vesicaria subsp. sativa]
MKKSVAVSKDDSVERYSLLLEQSFRGKGGDLRSKSLKLTHEERNSNSSLSSLDVLGSFLTELPRERETVVDSGKNKEGREENEQNEKRSQETETLLSPGLGQSSLEIYSHEEDEDVAGIK